MTSLGDTSLRPVLRRDLAVIPMPGGVQLRAGDEDIYFIPAEQSDLAHRVLINLDGTHSREDIARTIGGDNDGFVGSLITKLAEQGLFQAAGQDGGNGIDLYLSHFPSRRGATPSIPATSQIAILGDCPTAAVLSQDLREHGLTVHSCANPNVLESQETACRTAAVCVWERPDLAMTMKVNLLACQASIACLFVDLSHGQHASLGPFYIPGEGSCYACFRERLRQNTAAYAELAAVEQQMVASGAALPAYGMLPTFRYLLAGLTGAEIVAFFARHRPLRTLNRVITIDYERLRMWSEPAWRIPWCEVCGAAPR
jgi:bacteriocin biosynthesis cyclodehydratase domain-containing protein